MIKGEKKEKNKLKRKGLVFVGMSGGVDSSVAADLLKKDGYEVVGVHLVCFDENLPGCQAGQDRADAERAAAALDIKFEIWDLKKEYKKKVFDYMIDGYKRGETPNPDVMCNKEIKFGIFFKEAIKRGADYVATGHYAQIINKKGIYKLLAGKDKEKDQSYWLWNLNQEKLARILFPVGGMLKGEVRKEAKRFKLPNAEKKDSQGLCFVGKVDFQSFLRKKIKEKKGAIKDIKGKILGEHKGAFFYTIGQRKGIGLTGGAGEPYYVVRKDLKKNELIVSRKKAEERLTRKIVLRDANFISEESKRKALGEEARVRVRYRGMLYPAKIKREGKKFLICFTEPAEFVTAGQSAVFYSRRKEVLLGGVIAAIHS